MNFSQPKNKNSSRNEENLTERADNIFSHKLGTDVVSIAKKFLKPIMNPIFALSSISSNRSSSSSNRKNSSNSLLFYIK